MDKSQDERKRYGFFDFGRGILMILMALDHASKFYNAGSLKCEGLLGHFPLYIHKPQVITRLLGNIAAPGFIFTFGTMIAISSFHRSRRGHDQWSISSHLIKRGWFLIFLQFVVMSRLNVRFEILYCIGCLMILFAFFRRLPSLILMPLSIFLIIVSPYLSHAAHSPKEWVQYLLAAILTPSKGGLYPFLPWFGVAGCGYLFGTYFIKKWSHLVLYQLAGKFTIISATLMVFFFLVRIMRGFGNLYIWRQFTFGEFLLMSKYPPSLAFLLWNMALFYGILTISIGILDILPDKASGYQFLVKVIEMYGHVPLFFYILHIYIYEGVAAIFNIRKSLSLPNTYLLWLIGLIMLYPPCVWFYRLKRRYPDNGLLRML